MNQKINRFISFFKLWGTANWANGIDNPTIWQYIYTWRISIGTAWKVSGNIWRKQVPIGKFCNNCGSPDKECSCDNPCLTPLMDGVIASE